MVYKLGLWKIEWKKMNAVFLQQWTLCNLAKFHYISFSHACCGRVQGRVGTLEEKRFASRALVKYTTIHKYMTIPGIYIYISKYNPISGYLTGTHPNCWQLILQITTAYYCFWVLAPIFVVIHIFSTSTTCFQVPTMSVSCFWAQEHVFKHLELFSKLTAYF